MNASKLDWYFSKHKTDVGTREQKLWNQWLAFWRLFASQVTRSARRTPPSTGVQPTTAVFYRDPAWRQPRQTTGSPSATPPLWRSSSRSGLRPVLSVKIDCMMYRLVLVNYVDGKKRVSDQKQGIALSNTIVGMCAMRNDCCIYSTRLTDRSTNCA